MELDQFLLIEKGDTSGVFLFPITFLSRVHIFLSLLERMKSMMGKIDSADQESGKGSSCSCESRIELYAS